MLAPKARQVSLLDPELSRDASDLVALLRANPRVGRRQRKETLDEVETLFVRRAALELAGHEKVISRAKQTLLARRHLDDERGLLGCQFTFFLHQALHDARLVWGDHVVGGGQPAEHVGQGGDVSRLSRFKPVELGGNLLDRVAVGRFGPGGESKEGKDGRHFWPILLWLDNICDNIYCGHMPSRLRDEIKQTRPFRSVEEEAALSIVRTAALLEHTFAQAIKGHDITATQYNVLRILRGAGGEGLCRNEVGARLVRQVPDVTRLLDRMEQLDLIARQRGSKDRRYVTTTITKKGLDLLKKLDGKVDAINQELLGHLDAGRLRQLIQLLDTARHRP
jgi:DNA-binding MarR family transcriptional regulator